jgi:enoyl-[acyl-carrier-protein] reductase (NADH)
VSEGADIIPFQQKRDGEQSPFTPAERAQIMGTLAAVMQMQAQHEQQMSTLIALISEQQSHINDLEHDVARLKKDQAKKPVILNAQGARAN